MTSEYIGYMQFHIFIIAMGMCLLIAMMRVVRRDWEGLGIPVVVFGLSYIGAATSYKSFMWVVAAQQAIDLFKQGGL